MLQTGPDADLCMLNVRAYISWDIITRNYRQHYPNRMLSVWKTQVFCLNDNYNVLQNYPGWKLHCETVNHCWVCMGEWRKMCRPHNVANCEHFSSNDLIF